MLSNHKQLYMDFAVHKSMNHTKHLRPFFSTCCYGHMFVITKKVFRFSTQPLYCKHLHLGFRFESLLVLFFPHLTWHIDDLYSINTECFPIDCASLPVGTTWLVCCMETGHFVHKLTHLCLCAKTPKYWIPPPKMNSPPPALNSLASTSLIWQRE